MSTQNLVFPEPFVPTIVRTFGTLISSSPPPDLGTLIFTWLRALK